PRRGGSSMAQSALSTAQGATVRRRVSTLQLREAMAAYVFLLPTIVGLLLFTAGPVLASVYISFTRWNILGTPHWLGLDNYVRLAHDHTFWITFWNTLYYTVVVVPCGTILALLLAMVMNLPLRGISFYRATYFLPVVSSIVAVALMWEWLYQPDFGLINYLL